MSDGAILFFGEYMTDSAAVSAGAHDLPTVASAIEDNVGVAATAAVPKLFCIESSSPCSTESAAELMAERLTPIAAVTTSAASRPEPAAGRRGWRVEEVLLLVVALRDLAGEGLRPEREGVRALPLWAGLVRRLPLPARLRLASKAAAVTAGCERLVARDLAGEVLRPERGGVRRRALLGGLAPRIPCAVPVRSARDTLLRRDTLLPTPTRTRCGAPPP